MILLSYNISYYTHRVDYHEGLTIHSHTLTDTHIQKLTNTHTAHGKLMHFPKASLLSHSQSRAEDV